MEQAGGIQLHRGGPRGSEDRLSIGQQSAFAGLKAKTHCPALVSAQPESQGSDPSPLFGTCMATSRELGQVLGFLKKKCTIKLLKGPNKCRQKPWRWAEELDQDSLRKLILSNLRKRKLKPDQTVALNHGHRGKKARVLSEVYSKS